MANRVHTMALNGAPAQRFVAGPSPLGKRGTIALVLLCSVLAVAAAIKLSPPYLRPLPANGRGRRMLHPWARPFAVFGLVFSIPFYLTHHFVYRPNVGAAMD